MSSPAETRLARKYPQVAVEVLRHLLRLFGGDANAVQDQLQMMTASDLRAIQSSLQGTGPQTLSTSQRQRVKEFKSVSAVQSDKTAVRLLSQNGWDVESALNAFFSGDGMEEDLNASLAGNQGPAGSQGNSKELETLFEKYKAIGIREGASETTHNMEGAALTAFSTDLDPNDEDGFCLYVVAFLAKAEIPLTFTPQEFIGGLVSEGIRSLDDLRRRLPAYKSQVQQQPAAFREFYRFCYDWMRTTPATKVLDCETACDLWAILLRGRYVLLDQWLAYVKGHFRKAITRDVWTQFLDFIELKPDLSDYDMDGAWPLLFDEFVDHARKTFLSS